MSLEPVWSFGLTLSHWASDFSDPSSQRGEGSLGNGDMVGATVSETRDAVQPFKMASSNLFQSCLSSITKQLDSSNDSTVFYALLRSKHVLNISTGPPRRLLCARYAYTSSNTPAICLSIARASRTMSLCSEVLSYPSLPSGAVRYYRPLRIHFPALLEL